MPRKPDWYANFAPILSQLSSLEPERKLVRKNIEELFSVKRTEANRIMEIAGATPTGQGAKTVIEVSTLLRYVESRAGDFKKERKRRERIAHIVAEESSLTPARYSKFKLPKVPNFDDLSGIEFDSGVLRIEFTSFEDIMVKLVALSRAMLHQQGRFEEMVEKSLRPDCSLEVRAHLGSGDGSEAVSGSRSDL